MTRYGLLFWPILLLVSAGTLFSISYRVHGLRGELTHVERQILAEQEAIRVLEAEWAYVTMPNRLRNLIEMQTDLQPMAPVRVMDAVATIPEPLPFGLTDPRFATLRLPPERPEPPVQLVGGTDRLNAADDPVGAVIEEFVIQVGGIR